MDNRPVFFADQRLHFFRPLTGKYREQVVGCLRALYSRLYSSLADYSRIVQRDLVIEVFQETITRTPVLDESDDETAPPPRGEREQATWMLNLLMEYGWIERQVDEVTLTSTFGFSRIGRLFTQPMHEMEGGRYRTRHRNTRNTCSALRSFLDKQEAYDLLDAYEYSERIVADFSDVIAELDERKRQLVREVEAQQLVQRASEEFFDFMEKRFMPDLAMRFSEDSVVKYRDELDGLLRRARAQRREVKATVERELRRLAPELIADGRRSVYLQLLDQIESRLHSAAEIMLPALRSALHGFTRRADILLRQLSFSEASQHALLDAFEVLATMSAEQQDDRLAEAAAHLAVLNVGFVDPDHLRLYNTERKRVVSTAAETAAVGNPQDLRRLFIQQALERAFAVNNRELHDYLVNALAGGYEVSTAVLPIRDARELLYAAHVLEVGSASAKDSSYRFEVRATGHRTRNEFFAGMDEFLIRVVESPPALVAARGVANAAVKQDMRLNDYLETRLEPSAVTLGELRELLIRLMNYGVLVREESQTARELYDRFVRVEELTVETLALHGIELYHDRRFEYVRLYPPGSRTPGMDQSADEAFGGSLRARLTQNEVALILVLRAQYDKAVREGKIDERGYATELLEAISLAMKNWLSRSLPEKATERREVFRRLRQLRLIDYREEDDLDQAEAWIRIHPMIVDFVSTDAIDALQFQDGSRQENGDVP